jgi:hypothetical protein
MVNRPGSWLKEIEINFKSLGSCIFEKEIKKKLLGS